jgi:hypothetical protein
MIAVRWYQNQDFGMIDGRQLCVLHFLEMLA